MLAVPSSPGVHPQSRQRLDLTTVVIKPSKYDKAEEGKEADSVLHEAMTAMTELGIEAI